MGISLGGRYVGVSAQLANAIITNAKLATDIAIGGTYQLFTIAAMGTVVAGTWATSAIASQTFGYAMQNTTGAQNDEITYKVYLAAGTYSATCHHYKAADIGIYSIRIDGVEVQTFDGYNAGDVANVYTTQASIAIAANGLKTIGIKMTSKNAGSSAYRSAITEIIMVRTS